MQRRGVSKNLIVGAIVVVIIIVAAALFLGQGGGTQTTTTTTAATGETGETQTTTTQAGEAYKVSILTGSPSGTYYPVGTAYAKLLNKYSDGKIEATALEGRASVANIKDVCDGVANAALAQNDIAYYAYNGITIDAFKDNPQTCIRAIGILYPETIQIVTRADSDINTIYDLAGRKVAVGASGSGTYWNAKQILEAAGIWDQIIPEYKKFSEIVEDLKLGNIDAAFLTAGIPTSAVEQLAVDVGVKIIPVPDEVYQKLKDPFYAQVTIPAGTYKGVDTDVQTVAVMSMLLVHKDVPDDVAYLMTKILYEHADEIKQEVQKQSVQYISLRPQRPQHTATPRRLQVLRGAGPTGP